MKRAANHAFQVTSGVSGTIAANALKKDGGFSTTCTGRSRPCGRAQACQSKPGREARSCPRVAPGAVRALTRLSAGGSWARARAVSSATTARASSAARGRPASVKIRTRYSAYCVRIAADAASAFR